MDVKALEHRLKTTTDVEERLDLLDELAGHYYEQDDFERAEEFYRQAEKLATPGNDRAYFLGQRAVCHYLKHEDEQAYSCLIESRDSFDPNKEGFVAEVYGLVQYFLGSLYEYKGDSKRSLKARLASLKYLEELPRDAQWMLLSGIGRNYDEMGEHGKAIEYSHRAIDLIGENDPELAYLYEALGYNYFEMGEYKEALAAFSKVLEIAPDFERKDEVYFSIGFCNQKLSDFQTALRAYQRILEMKKLRQEEGSMTWLLLEIARCHYQLKDHHESLEVARAALKEPIDERDEMAELRGLVTNNLHALGRDEEAVREGEAALKISTGFPNMEHLLANLALSYYRLNQKEKFRYYRDWCNKAFPDAAWTRQLNKLQV